MFEISHQPYIRTYVLPMFSLGNLIRLILYATIIILPFFIVFSTPNFYQNSNIKITKPSYSINGNYWISIKTTQNTYIYNNFYQDSSNTKPLQLSVKKLQQISEVTLQWSKSVSEKVKQVVMILSIDYNSTDSGLIKAKISGYNIAQGATVGKLIITKGLSTFQNSLATILTLSKYNFQNSMILAQQNPYFLTYKYSSLPISYPNDKLVFKMSINESTILIEDKEVSILGQLVWSWIQYCPIMLVCLWAFQWAFSMLLKEGVFPRKIIDNQ